MDGVRLAELAAVAGGELVGEGGDVVVAAVHSLEGAGPDDLSFVRSARFKAAALASKAGAFVVSEELRALAAESGRPCIVAGNPDLVVIRILEHLRPLPQPAPGIHPTAVVDGEARLEATVSRPATMRVTFFTPSS